jgi:hypothetical protein
MAAEKQIAANRENAKRSTGPKTVAGRLISSRNAYRHGFSCPLPFDPATLAKVDVLAHALAGKEADQERLMTAAEFAEAQLELSRIRATRTALIAKIDLLRPTSRSYVGCWPWTATNATPTPSGDGRRAKPRHLELKEPD